LEGFAERVSLTTWERLAGMIVRWHVLAIVIYAVFWVVWALSGSNAYNMVTNMIIGVSGLIVIIVILEVLKRKIK
jgi:thiamine transporter ThiT